MGSDLPLITTPALFSQPGAWGGFRYGVVSNRRHLAGTTQVRWGGERGRGGGVGGRAGWAGQGWRGLLLSKARLLGACLSAERCWLEVSSDSTRRQNAFRTGPPWLTGGVGQERLHLSGHPGAASGGLGTELGTERGWGQGGGTTVPGPVLPCVSWTGPCLAFPPQPSEVWQGPTGPRSRVLGLSWTGPFHPLRLWHFQSMFGLPTPFFHHMFPAGPQFVPFLFEVISSFLKF